MSWYLQRGKDSDIVINSKVVYSRNLRNYKFETNDMKEITEIEKLIKENLPSLGYNLKFLKIKDMDEITIQTLIEKGLIKEDELKQRQNYISILLNDEENICIVLNSQDYIELQVFSSGMEIENVFNFAKEIDQKIEEIFDIAKSKKYGYLTTSPINIGTGLNAEITVHLPGLTKTGNMRKIIQTVTNFGLNITGKYINNSEIIGDIYVISNKQTLGISEENIIRNIEKIIEKLIEQERAARKLLGKNNIELEDLVYRSFGILINSRKLRWQEALELLSDVKLGTDLGIINELTDEKIAKMYLYISAANLQKYFGQNLEAYDREIKRAELLKQILNEK